MTMPRLCPKPWPKIDPQPNEAQASDGPPADAQPDAPDQRSASRNELGPIECDGSLNMIRVRGEFITQGGLSTGLEVNMRTRQADGSLARGVLLRTIREPGDYCLPFGVGELTLNAFGPHHTHWFIDIELCAKPKTAPVPTTEERLKALERAVAAR